MPQEGRYCASTTSATRASSARADSGAGKAAPGGSKFLVEGNCDERGSAEYNLALGERRARAAKEFLTQVGVPDERLMTISYGQERPACTDHNEECWQKNRRAHLTASR